MTVASVENDRARRYRLLQAIIGRCPLCPDPMRVSTAYCSMGLSTTFRGCSRRLVQPHAFAEASKADASTAAAKAVSAAMMGPSRAIEVVMKPEVSSPDRSDQTVDSSAAMMELECCCYFAAVAEDALRPHCPRHPRPYQKQIFFDFDYCSARHRRHLLHLPEVGRSRPVPAYAEVRGTPPSRPQAQCLYLRLPTQ